MSIFLKSFPVTFSYKKLNKGWEKISKKNFLYLWTPFSQNDTIFKFIFSDLAWVIALELFNLQARATPHFKGNFVEIQDLIITPIPQNATSVSFCQIGSLIFIILQKYVRVYSKDYGMKYPKKDISFWNIITVRNSINLSMCDFHLVRAEL